MRGFVEGVTGVKPSDITCMRSICLSFLHGKLHSLQTKMPLLDVPSIINKSGIIRLVLGISNIPL